MTPREFLSVLQSQAENGFNKELGVWVDPSSSIAKFVEALEEE